MQTIEERLDQLEKRNKRLTAAKAARCSLGRDSAATRPPPPTAASDATPAWPTWR